MSSNTLRKGENKLYGLYVTGNRGQNILYSEITSASISFVQNDTTIVSYGLTDTEVREGEDENEIVVELRQSISNQLTIGRPLYIRYEITVPNIEFEADQSQKEIGERKIEDNVL